MGLQVFYMRWDPERATYEIWERPAIFEKEWDLVQEEATVGSPFPKNAGDTTNPKDLIGLTKPPLRLVPPVALLKMAKVMELGARKYGPYNWREKQVRYTVYLEAALRHIYSALDGEEIDPESGQPHTAHAAACMAIILDAQSLNQLVDDRAAAGATAETIRQMTETK
jgi:hypothetical protein